MPGDRSVSACAKLVDKLVFKSDWIIRYDELLFQLVKRIFSRVPLSEMPVNIKARLLKNYCTVNAHTQHVRTHSLINSLASDLTEHLEEIDETIVFDLLEAANISQNVPGFE